MPNLDASQAMHAPHILLVEDNPADARLTQLLLQEADDFRFELVHVSSFEQGVTALASGDFDIALVDLSLGDSHGIDTVRRLHQRAPLMPLVVLSGLEDETMAMATLHEGAQDYLVKGQSDGNLIKRAIRYAMERKRAEAQLIETKNSAEAASRAKTEFLANMSHELRTPLNAIIGFSEILKQETLGPLGHPSYRDYVRDVYESGVHLLHIINDILDLSKIEVGKLTLNEAPIEPREAIESCVRIVRERVNNASLNLVVDVAPELPTFNADERMVKQILLNLLSNAIKFTPAGGSVRIVCRVDGDDGLILEVIDTGIGISPADIERALQPFEQIDSSLHRKYQGTGLGLPLARSMCQLHGGRLEIESAAGRGTTVTVRFPPERSLRAAPAACDVSPSAA
jgi:signal transduction histidine kinase